MTAAAPRPGLRLSALGGPHTFGAQAAHRMRELYPQFGEITYYPTSEAAQEAVDRDEVDATCAPEQMARTGFHVQTQLRIGAPGAERYVAAEVTHAYHCSLLVKPGTPLARVRRVIGHTGSVTQSRGWLAKHLADAEVEIVGTSSLGAAMEVVAGDGTTAAIGTPEAARALGLEEAAKEIDGGSVGCYWALSKRPLFSERPTRLVVTGRFRADGRAGEVVAALAAAGHRLLTVATLPSGLALYEYDHVMRFGGDSSLDAARQAVAGVPGAKLSGAFEARDQP